MVTGRTHYNPSHARVGRQQDGLLRSPLQPQGSTVSRGVICMSWESSSIVTGWSLGPRSQEVGEKLEWHSLLTLEDLLAACAHPVSTLYAP